MQHINKIFQNSSQNLDISIKGDDNAVWVFVYQVEGDSLDIIMDGFLCSRGEILENQLETIEYVQRGEAPPICREFASEECVVYGLAEDDIDVIWGDKKIDVQIFGETYLLLDLETRKSYSKAVKVEGVYGLPLT